MECLRKKLAQDRDRRQGSKAFVFHPRGGEGKSFVERVLSIFVHSYVLLRNFTLRLFVFRSILERSRLSRASHPPSFVVVWGKQR